MRRAFRILAALAFLLCITEARAAVSVDTCGTEARSSTNQTSFGYVDGAVTTGNALVTIVTVLDGGPISGVTANWDNGGTPQSQTVLGSANNGGNAQIFFFGLRSPTAGNKTALISWTTGAQVSIVTCSWNGADTTSNATAFKNFNSATGSNTSTQSVTITSTANDAVMAAHDGVGTSYASVNNTQIFIDNAGNTFAAAGNRVAGAVNPTMTASFSGTFTTVSAGISIAAPGGAAATCVKGSLALMGAGC